MMRMRMMMMRRMIPLQVLLSKCNVQLTHSEVIKFRHHWKSPANGIEESRHLTHVGEGLHSHHLRKAQK